MDDSISEDEIRIRRGHTDLDSEDERVLERDGIILSKLQTSSGTQRVSGSILSSPRSRHDSARGSDETSSGSPENSIMEVRHMPASSDVTALDLPASADSIAGLRFIGLCHSTAEKILSRWQSACEEDGPEETHLLEFITGHFATMGHPRHYHLPERQRLEYFGVDTWLVDALLNPEYEEVAKTESLRYWVQDSLRVSYRSLIALVRRLKLAAYYGKTRKKQAQASAANLSSSMEQSVDPVITANMTIDILMPGAPQSSLAIQERPELIPDHLLLYKGMANMEEEPGLRLVDAKGHLSLDSSLATSPGGNFNAQQLALYFTRQRETAEQYRKWARERSPAADTWLVTIQIPRLFFDDLATGALYFENPRDQWRRFVWTCRQRKVDERSAEERDLLFFHREAQVIEGHIFGSKYLNLRDHPQPTDLTREHMMKLRSGVAATQVVFLQQRTFDALSHELMGKIHIQCFPGLRDEGSQR